MSKENVKRNRLKIALISTFRTNCGVGKYCEDLAGELSKLVDVKVFAENLLPPQIETEPLKGTENVVYERCWNRIIGFDEKFVKKVLEFKPDVVHFQFVSGVFKELDYKLDSNLQKIVAFFHSKGIKTVFTLHDIPEFHKHGEELSKWYEKLESLFIVMNPAMNMGLKKWFPNGIIYEIPLGTPLISDVEKTTSENFIITQTGYYGVDKGMLGIIKAIPKIKIPNLKIVFAGGFHPLADLQHKPYVLECMKTAINLGVTDKVEFLNRNLSEKELDQIILSSDFLILNQQMVYGYSTSASAHRILLAKKPIIMSSSPKLSEFENYVTCLKAVNDDDIADVINVLYENLDCAKTIAENAYVYGMITTFNIIAKKHLVVYQ